jgi:hypothetical protein
VSNPETTEEDAKKALEAVQGTIDDLIRTMKACPFVDQVDRVASVLGMMANFEPNHYRMVAAMAVERLTQFQMERPLVHDVADAEDFMLRLMAGLIVTDTWKEHADRNRRVQGIAKGIFESCTPSQLSILAAVGMMRQFEALKGPEQ